MGTGLLRPLCILEFLHCDSLLFGTIEGGVGNIFNFPALEYNSIEVPVFARQRNKARNRRYVSNE